MERVVMWAWQVLRRSLLMAWEGSCKDVMWCDHTCPSVWTGHCELFLWAATGRLIFSDMSWLGHVFFFLVGFYFDIGMYRFQQGCIRTSQIQITANSHCGQAVLEFEQYQKNVHVWTLAHCGPLASKISKQSQSGFCGSPFSFSKFRMAEMSWKPNFTTNKVWGWLPRWTTRMIFMQLRLYVLKLSCICEFARSWMKRSMLQWTLRDSPLPSSHWTPYQWVALFTPPFFAFCSYHLRKWTLTAIFHLD